MCQVLTMLEVGGSVVSKNDKKLAFKELIFLWGLWLNKLMIKQAMKSSILNIMTQKDRVLQNMGIREVRECFLEEVIFKPRPKG